MANDDIKQIMINGHLVGIAGLSDILEKTAKNHQGKSDEDIKNILLSDVIINNYVPQAAMDVYGQALLREFKISQGLPAAEEPVHGLNIMVLGPGCTRCTQLENDVRDLLSEMNIAANLHHITDSKEIAQYGLLGSPALIINNKVFAVGEVPPKSKIRQWIIDAYKLIDK